MKPAYLKTLSILGLVLILFISTLSIISCNPFSEPEPLVNNETHSANIYSNTILKNYCTDEVVTGIINPSFIPDIPSSLIDSVRLYVDNTCVSKCKKSPYNFNVNTKNWVNGKHDINFYVYKKPFLNDSLGVLNYVYANLQIYKTTLIFNDCSISLSAPRLGVIDNINNTVIFYENLNNIYGHGRFEAYSTQTAERLYINTSEIIRSFVSCCKSLDGKSLYLSTGKTIYVIDLSTTDFLNNLRILDWDKAEFNINSKTAFAVRSNSLIYFSDNAGNLIIMQNSNSIGGYLFLSKRATYKLFDSPVKLLSISPDGQQMLSVEKNVVKNYNLSGYTVSLLSQFSIVDSVELFCPNWTNSRIFITHQNTILEALDTQSLNSISKFQLPGSMPTATDIKAIRANSKFLYAAYNINGSACDSSIVAEYDIATQNLTRSWKYCHPVLALAGSDDGRYMFACTASQQWLIDLGGN